VRGLLQQLQAARPIIGIKRREGRRQDRRAYAAVGDRVRRAVAGLSAPDGGTEIGPAIDAVLAGREAADVLIVTDGKSHALDIHAAARRGARFTVVLVGEDSLAANLGHLAVLTGGQVFVSSGADLAEVLGMAVAGIVNLVGYKACVIVRQYNPELHTASWTHVSCRHTRKASARACRY
jgi:hypothetical protein